MFWWWLPGLWQAQNVVTLWITGQGAAFWLRKSSLLGSNVQQMLQVPNKVGSSHLRQMSCAQFV